MAVAVRHRFTVAEFQRMGETGILAEDARVELIDGEIVEMTAVGSRHVACVNRLNALLSERLGRGRAIVQIQSPVVLDEHHEPEPDVVVLRYRSDYYAAALPSPADVLLLIEVADSSLAFDQNVKLPVYARNGISEVWIVDVDGGVIEQHVGAMGEAYTLTERVGRGSSIVSTALPAATFRVDDILGV